MYNKQFIFVGDPAVEEQPLIFVLDTGAEEELFEQNYVDQTLQM